MVQPIALVQPAMFSARFRQMTEHDTYVIVIEVDLLNDRWDERDESNDQNESNSPVMIAISMMLWSLDHPFSSNRSING